MPFVAWGPGVVPAGVTNDTTVIAAVDLLPTLARLCGAALPKGYAADGEDLSAALRGETPDADEAAVLGVRPQRHVVRATRRTRKHRSPNVAVRDGDWKLLVNADGTGAELYDLADDPKEAKDLAADQPDVAKRLTDSALTWRKSLP